MPRASDPYTSLMRAETLPVLTPEPPAVRPWSAVQLEVNPFLHVGPDRVYNPLIDRALLAGEPGYAELRALLARAGGPGEAPAAERARLAEAGWLVPADSEPERRFLLKYVSLEAHTVCNQACYFCPVSVAPREDHFMPMDLYERILGELSVWRDTIEAVFMINYNEPTADRRFVEQVRAIKAAGLRPAVLTNGTGLTPARI